MRILSVHFRAIRIPLNFQFRQSNNIGTSTSSSAIVELHTADGTIGYGESCPRTYVTGESMADVAKDIGTLQPELCAIPIHSLDELQARLKLWEQKGIGASTRCAIELAWLDAWSRSTQKPLPDLLGITYRETLSYSLVLPLISVAALEKLLQRLSTFQPLAIKLKVDGDQVANLNKIRLLHSHFGVDFPIRVDVNGGWSLEQAKTFIPAFLDLNVHSFEQVVQSRDLESMKVLTQLFSSQASIMADETLLSPQFATHLLENKICNHFNLKISKLGGLFSSLEVYHIAEQFGIPCQWGAHFGETSLLTSAGALLAAQVEGELSACEGALGELLLSKDIAQSSISHSLQGTLDLSNLWQTPGLVKEIQLDKLHLFSI